MATMCIFEHSASFNGPTLSPDIMFGWIKGATMLPVGQNRIERRLAAILVADVAGYSRLMGRDDEGTLAQFKGHVRELIEPKIKEHRGRIIRMLGVGMLVEFARVVVAL